MKQEELMELLKLGEGPKVQFMANLKALEAIGHEVCGFLNTSGGYVVCGVNKRGALLGVDFEDDEIAAFEKALHDGLSPKSLVAIAPQKLDGKSVVVIEVPQGHDVPYAFRNAIFVREDDASVQADPATIRDMVLRSQIEPERWERRFSVADLDIDFDVAQLHAAVADAEKVKRAFLTDKSDPYRVLVDLSAARFGRLTNGGDVLFTKNPAVRLPQTRIRAMRYNSDKVGEKFSDMKSFEGPLHSIFEEAYTFIVRNTPSVARFVKGNPKRQDSPLYPEDAVREALINALAHRDYAASSGGIAIHIYPRRLEIWNSGAFLNGVTPESIAKGQISVLRNPDIAHVLYLRGLMEKTGRGGRLIVDECVNAGLPSPSWISDASGVTITFETTEVDTQATMEVTTQATTEATMDVTTQVRRLIRHLDGTMDRQAIQGTVNIANVEYFRKSYIQPALQAGFIEMTQPDKPQSPTQRYRLTAKGRALKAQLTSADS